MARRWKTFRSETRTGRPLTVSLSAVALWFVAAVLAVTAVGPGTDHRPADGHVTAVATIHVIDAGHGDAILVETATRTVLIDAGDWWGGGRVVQYLRQRGHRQLDAVILTHPAPAHAGGMAHVLDAMDVDLFFDAGAGAGGTTYQQLLDRLSRMNVARERLHNGHLLVLEEGVVLEALAPYEDLGWESDLMEERDPTLVLRLDVGAIRFLLASRLSQRGERLLTRVQPPERLEATVLKVARHGDRSATGTTLLDRVDPEYAVITAGIYNEFGHPHQVVLQRLAERQVQILRTDHHGHIRFDTDGRTLRWTTQYRGEPGAARPPEQSLEPLAAGPPD